MKLNEYNKLLTQLKEKCDNSNLNSILFITEKEKSLIVGRFNNTDIKNMLVGLLEDLTHAERLDILKDVLIYFIQ